MRSRSTRPRGMRLQKFLSDAGVASRRHAEELILEGHVLVNDELVDTLPAFVDPEEDVVVVNGNRVRAQPHEYFIIHKPKGVVCTNKDPAGRRRAIDFLPPLPAPLFPVGRLDEDSSGLLIMTNDGELVQQITHPRSQLAKVYRAEVRGHVGDDLPEKLKKGVYLSEGRARAAEAEILHRGREASVLQITLLEQRNRQVRRMLARLGHPVKKLKRVAIGPLDIKGLGVGGARRLSPGELKALRAQLSGVSSDARVRRKPRRASGADLNAGGAVRQTSKPKAPKKPEARKPARSAPAKPRPPRDDDSGPRRRLIT